MSSSVSPLTLNVLTISLVCSDLIARGMDLPSVSHVVSYDIPLDMRKYVHRVGRTARAGRSGTAWSLVENQEVSYSPQSLPRLIHADFPDVPLQIDAESSGSRKEDYKAKSQGQGPGRSQTKLRGCYGQVKAIVFAQRR